MKGKMMCRSIVVWAPVLLSMFLLSACGSSSKKSTSPATAPNQANAAIAGMNTCVTCHTPITADWLTSRHANLDPFASLSSAGVPTIGQMSDPTCVVCHDPDGDSARLVAGYTGNVQRPVVGCEACHGGGSEHASHGGAGPISFASKTAIVIGSTSTVQVSALFNTCTSCHPLLDPVDPLNSSASLTPHVVGGRVNNINDTHFAEAPYTATPGSWNEADGRNDFFTTPGSRALTGYWMSYADEKVCVNCHNPHKNAEINREWAASAHGDPNGAKTGFFSGAWSQYNWSCEGKVAASCGVSGTPPNPRSFTACQRCHTTTGFMNYADAIRNGETTTSEAIRLGTINIVLLSGATDTYPNWKPQMLECNACHLDNKGTLRNPGAVTANYDIDVQPAAPAPPVLNPGKKSFSSVAYPDLGASNVCMLCHIGRQNGASLKNTNDPALLSAGTITSSDFSTSILTNPHYLTAGATLFTSSGYMYDGRPYNNLSAFKHDKIGTAAAPGTGTGGPCVGCHMSRPNKNGNHLFLPVSRVAPTLGGKGTINGIASEMCFNCHGPSSQIILDMVKEQREQYHEALEALNLMLERRGFYFREFSPYFYQIRSNSSPSFSTGATATLSSSTTVDLASVATISAGTSTTASTGNADFFRFDSDQDGVWYRITNVDAVNRRITLATEFIEATTYAGKVSVGSGGPYTIIRGAPGGSVRDFRSKPTWFHTTQVADTDTTGAVTGKNNQGAVLNYNLLEHDPGGYVHNRIFAKRIIYDSIDWMDDNKMNNSVGATLNALDGTFYIFKNGAMRWLLPNGVITGVEAERP